MRKRRGRRVPSTRPPRSALIEQFSAQDLERWETQSVEEGAYRDRVYFDLERQRVAYYDDLCAALAQTPAISVIVDDWVRVTAYRWALSPLSSTGSLKGIGGRFNIGSDIDRARGQAFRCLYLAQDIDTSYREYFGGLPNTGGKLTLSELALQRPDSFATFRLRGQLDDVLDLRSHAGLKAFAKLIATFEVSGDTARYARQYRIAPQRLLKTAHQLWKALLCSPARWRLDPQMFGIPAPSQLFGRLARDAGFQALLYPSQQGGNLCLAVFPEKVKGTETSIRIVGEQPPEARCTLLDRNHLCLD